MPSGHDPALDQLRLGDFGFLLFHDQITTEAIDILMKTFLPDFCPDEGSVAYMSAVSKAWSYIPCLVTIALSIIFKAAGADPPLNIQYTIVLAAFWGITAFYATTMFRNVPARRTKDSKQGMVSITISEAKAILFRLFRDFPESAKYIVALCFANNGVFTTLNCIITYMSVKVKMAPGQLSIITLEVLVFAALGAAGFSVIAFRVRLHKALYCTLVGWAFFGVTPFVVYEPEVHLGRAYAVGAGLGVILGLYFGTQYATMVQLLPKHYIGQFTGLYPSLKNAASITGPAIYAYIVQTRNDHQMALFLAVVPTFAMSFVPLCMVDFERGHKMAQEDEARHQKELKAARRRTKGIESGDDLDYSQDPDYRQNFTSSTGQVPLVDGLESAPSSREIADAPVAATRAATGATAAAAEPEKVSAAPERWPFQPLRDAKEQFPEFPVPPTLRAKFPDEPEAYLSRFLAFNTGDEAKTAEQYANHLKWLKTLPSDMQSQAEEEIRKGKLYIRGRDREGRLNIWWRTGKNDPQDRDLDTASLMATYWVLALQEMLDAEADTTTGDNRANFIIDRTDNVLDLKVLLEVVPILQEQFPLRLHKIYITPTNFFLRAVINIVWPALNSEIQEALVVLPDCPDLVPFIDPSNIPVRMQGTDTWEFEYAEAPKLHLFGSILEQCPRSQSAPVLFVEAEPISPLLAKSLSADPGRVIYSL